MALFGRRRRKRSRGRKRSRRNPILRSRKRYSRRRLRRNPARSYRRRSSGRRFRRNPMGSVRSYMPLVLGGVVGAVTVRAVPRLLGVVGIPYYGVQAAIVVGGGWAAGKYVSRSASDGFIVGAAATALYDVVKGFLGTTFSMLGLGDIGAYPELGAYTSEAEGAYNDLQGMSYHDSVY